MANTKVTGDVIANGTISTVHIADDAITAAKLDSTATGITFADLAVDTDTLYVDSANNRVGIGTTSPDEMLHIENSSGANIILNSNTVAVNNGIYMSEGSSSTPTYNGAYFYYDSSANAVKLDTGTSSLSTKLTILRDSGNVGIGTTSPSTKLHIEGATVGYLQTIKNTTAGGDYLQMLAETGDPVFQFQSTGTGGEATLNMYRDGTQYVKISADAGVNNYFNNGANVGIGTTSPAEKLHVNSGTGNVPALFESTDNLSLITFKDNNTTTDVGIGADDNDEVFYTGGSERMRIDSSGDVGVGTVPETAGPTWRTLFVGASLAFLSRQSAAGSDSIVANNYYINSSNADVKRVTGTSSRMFLDGDVIRFQNSGSGAADSVVGWDERMRIAANGNVGIGTTSPSATLHVQTAGGIKLFNDATYGYISIGSSGLTGQYPYLRLDSFRSDGSGYFWAFGHETPGGVKSIKMLINDSGNDEVTIIRSLAIGTFTANEFNGSYPSLSTGALIRSNDHSYLNGGNVGIGTTSPLSKLDARGALMVGSAAEDGNFSSTTATGMSNAESGMLEITQGWVGSASSGDTVVFRYDATQWKSWGLEWNFMSTNGMSSGFIGGYNNNSTGHSKVTHNNAHGVTVSFSNSSQNNIITFTFTTLGTHPMASFRYYQSGGDGRPYPSKASITINS